MAEPRQKRDVKMLVEKKNSRMTRKDLWQPTRQRDQDKDQRTDRRGSQTRLGDQRVNMTRSLTEKTSIKFCRFVSFCPHCVSFAPSSSSCGSEMIELWSFWLENDEWKTVFVRWPHWPVVSIVEYRLQGWPSTYPARSVSAVLSHSHCWTTTDLN